MSRILEKPFSWANKIVRAVFKGSPNLITTSDLNRQIEALKKEMYAMQQAVGVVISDLTSTFEVVEESVTYNLKVQMSYVFCAGVRFDLSVDRTFALNNVRVADKELRLYAKRIIVNSEDDFSKDISGAKFEDGTTQPAASHYVYEDAKVELVNSDTPDADFDYEDNAGYEYVCTLLKLKIDNNTNYDNVYYVQNLTVPMGSGMTDVPIKHRDMKPLQVLSERDYADDTKRPFPNMSLQEYSSSLWNRLATLERRMFLDSYFDSTENQVSFNGLSRNTERHVKVTLQGTSIGDVTVDAYFCLVGNICFIKGELTHTQDAGLISQVDIDLTGKVPLPLKFVGPYRLNILTEYNNATTGYILLNMSCSADDKALLHIRGFSEGGAGIKNRFSGIYCVPSTSFWRYDRSDYYNFPREVLGQG